MAGIRLHSARVARVDARGPLYELLNTGAWKSILYGQMKRHAVMGGHYHKRTAVFFFLTRGRAQMTSVSPRTGRRRRITLNPLDGVFLPTWTAHAIRFTAPSAFIVLKSRPYRHTAPDTFPYPVR